MCDAESSLAIISEQQELLVPPTQHREPSHLQTDAADTASGRMVSKNNGDVSRPSPKLTAILFKHRAEARCTKM
jgi:hypothetical protein